MAKLLAYYSLCPINDIREFLGLSRDVDTGCVINTLGRNIVQVVKLSNQKLLHSWTAVERLTSKVVYDFRSNRYVGVFGGRYVRCWEASQVDISRVKKVKFFRNILELFTIDNGQVVVLYDDGSCESLESAVETRNEDRQNPESIKRKPNVNPSRESIEEVSALMLHSGEVMLAYFVKDSESGSISLHYALLTKESLKPSKGFRKIKLKRVEQKVQLVGQCVVDGNGAPAMVTIWSDKRIFSQPLTFDEDSLEVQQRSIGNFISILNIINTNQPLAMIGISKEYIAIYANNLNQEGATLLLYNVQFKVVQAKQFFKVYFNNARFWLCENHILLGFGQILSAVPFKISKEQLSDMVGTQRSLELERYVDNESINEDCDFNEGYTFVGQLKNVVKDESEPDDHEPEKVFDVFESVEKFEESLHTAYKSSIQVDLIRDESLPGDVIQMRLMSNVDRSIGSLIFSERFELFTSELEKNGFSEVEITDKILPLMMQVNASLDIGKCLKRYSNVSERSLVAVLKYALTCKDKQLPISAIPTVDELYVKYANTSVPASNSYEELPNQNIINNHNWPNHAENDLLNIVLSCSFNKHKILPLLRNELTLTTTLHLLDHLLVLLTDPVACLPETPTYGDNFDSDERVVEWASLLIDSHYQQIILSLDAAVKRKLVSWVKVIKEHRESLNELKSLSATIQRLAERKSEDGAKRFNQWYSVETVQLY